LLITKKYLKHNFRHHFAMAVAILLLTTLFFGINGLDAKAAAIPLETMVALTGIVLLVPVFAPEQEPEIRDVVEAKYTWHLGVCILRAVVSIVANFMLILLFVLYMKAMDCKIPALKYGCGTFAGSLFLGALGLFAYGVSENIAVGYMLPIAYYIYNFGAGSKNLGKLFSKLYLFSMAKGSFEEKYWLLGAGMILVVMTFIIKIFVRKSR